MSHNVFIKRFILGIHLALLGGGCLSVQAQDVTNPMPANVSPGAVMQYNLKTSPLTPAGMYYSPFFLYGSPPSQPEEEPVMTIEEGVFPEEQQIQRIYRTPDGRLYLQN